MGGSRKTSNRREQQMKTATFQISVTVKFEDDGENDVTDQAWDALQEKLPSGLMEDGRLIGKVEDDSHDHTTD